MTSRSLAILADDRQLFPRSIAEAVGVFLRERGLSAKQAARRYDIDPATAANIPKGVCAIGTLLKIAVVEGRAFWNWIGDQIYGETQDEWEERQLLQIINEADDARQKLVRLRARREALAADAADALDLLDRPGPHEHGARHG